MKYLGHNISKEGVATSPDRYEKIQNWPTPETIEEIRSFLGMASYFRRFIQNFARIAGPLHDLVNMHSTPGKKSKSKKSISIKEYWESTHQEAFEELKRKLTSTPVLGFADFGKPFLLETDASHEGLGAIL